MHDTPASLALEGPQSALGNIEAYVDQHFPDVDIDATYRCASTTSDGDRCENTVDELGAHCSTHAEEA